MPLLRAAAVLACLVWSAPILAADAAPPEEASDDSAELAKKLQNPVAALISVPFQSNFEWGGGPGSHGFKDTLNFQPVIPIRLTESLNVISRTIVPIIHQDDVVAGTSQGGMGDVLQSLFLSPRNPGPWSLIWGIGPAFLLPTSTDEFLGNEKFGLGPTAVVLRQESGWTYGMLANHVVSIGGTSATSDVNSVPPAVPQLHDAHPHDVRLQHPSPPMTGRTPSGRCR